MYFNENRRDKYNPELLKYFQSRQDFSVDELVADFRLTVKCSEGLLMFSVKLQDHNPMQFIKYL